MKFKILLPIYFILLINTFSVFAQNGSTLILNDYENIKYAGSFWNAGGSISTVDNPFKSGLNISEKVLKFSKDGQWQLIGCNEWETPIQLSKYKAFVYYIYSTVPWWCAHKVEYPAGTAVVDYSYPGWEQFNTTKNKWVKISVPIDGTKFPEGGIQPLLWLAPNFSAGAAGDYFVDKLVLVANESVAPGTPSDFLVTGKTAASISLSWANADDDVEGFNLYRNGAKVNEDLIPTKVFKINGVPANSSNKIEIEAVDYSGNISGKAEVNVTTDSDSDAPSTPSTLTNGTINGNSVVLNWASSTDNSGVVIYEIHNGNSKVGESTSTSYTVTGLSVSTVYTFTVKAKDEAGNISEASNALQVTTPAVNDILAPSIPSGLGATNILENGFVLSWQPSTDNVAVTGYEIYQNSNLIGTSALATYSVGGLVANWTYSFSVKSKDAIGNISEESAKLSVTTKKEVVQTSNSMGINIGSGLDYEEDRIFADAMMSGRGWQSVGGGSVALDENGWPTADAEVIVWHGIDHMNGTYKLSFNGSATISTGFGNVTLSNISYNSTSNTTSADLKYNNTDASGLKLIFSSTSGGVKNVKLMRPISLGSTVSYSSSSTFTDQIKNLIGKFSAIRFMDFTSTNSNNSVNWTDRVKPDYYRGSYNSAGYGWQGVGNAWEYAIQLCNETGKDAWICVPAKASETYIQELAKLWKEKLDPKRKLYVEFSNEVWNTSSAFQQSNQNHNAAISEVGSGSSPLNYDNETNDWYWAWRRVGLKAVQISNIFRSVFGDESMMTRIRPVLMWQLGYAEVGAQMLKFIDDVYSKVNKWNSVAHSVNYYIYGGGGSAYYNPDNGSDGLTLDNIWDSQTFDSKNWVHDIKSDASWCNTFGIKRIAYEGGPSMDKQGKSESVKAQAVNDLRMKDEIIEHQQVWNNYNGGLLCYFNDAGGFEWGFTEDIFDLSTPKLLGIDWLNEANRDPVTFGNVPPFTAAGKEFIASRITWRSPGTGSQLCENDEWFSYAFRTLVNGKTTFKAEYAYASGGTIEIMVDGQVVGTANADGAGFTPSYSVYLPSGLHSVRLRAVSGKFDIVKVLFEDIETDIAVVSQDKGLSVFPNPVVDNLAIIARSDIGFIRLFDMSGRQLKLLKCDSNTFNLNMSDLNQGLYILKVFLKNTSVITTKVIKQ